MNFQEFRFPSGTPLMEGDLVRFNRYAGEGSRKTQEWIGIISKFKAHKIKVYLPMLNIYEEIRNNVIMGFEHSLDDMNPNSKASQILRFAAPKIKQLAEEYNG